MTRFRRTSAGAALAAAALAVSGCGGAEGSAGTARQGSTGGETRFVEGSGTVTAYDAGDRTAAPELTGTLLDGEPFDLADQRGDVVVLNTWGSWCAPCRAEAPALREVSESLAPRGVRFVGINVRDNSAARDGFLERFAIPFPSVDDTDGRARLALRGVLPASVPATVVVDRDGRVAATVAGALDEAGLRRVVEPVAAEAAAG